MPQTRSLRRHNPLMHRQTERKDDHFALVSNQSNVSLTLRISIFVMTNVTNAKDYNISTVECKNSMDANGIGNCWM